MESDRDGAGGEKIAQAPAPFHVIARGWAGPSLLARCGSSRKEATVSALKSGLSAIDTNDGEVGPFNLITRDNVAASAPALRESRAIVRVCGKRDLIRAGQRHQRDDIR
jgi:hypothetical protein